MIVGGVAGTVIGAVSAAISGGDTADIIIGAIAGAAGGVLAASGVGAVGQAIGSAAISMISNATTQVKNITAKKQDEFDVKDMLFDGVVGLATGILGGRGASHGNTGGITKAGKQLLKKGLFNIKAQAYYAKTAHRMGGEFVLTELGKSLGKNTLGSIVTIGKNHMRAGGYLLW